MNKASNIYISVTEPVDSSIDSSSSTHGYRRAVHTWMISIESHHHFHLPGTHAKEPIHLTNTNADPSSPATISNVPLHSETTIIGNILIASKTPHSASEIQAHLTSNPNSTTPEITGEEWLEVALTALQKAGYVSKFDIHEFMLFARGYEATRVAGEGHARIAYPRLFGKELEDHGSRTWFWISVPQDLQGQRMRRRQDGRGSVYGGLM